MLNIRDDALPAGKVNMIGSGQRVFIGTKHLSAEMLNRCLVFCFTRRAKRDFL